MKVCRQYLAPFLSNLSHDSSLLRAQTLDSNGDDASENKENNADTTQDVSREA